MPPEVDFTNLQALVIEPYRYRNARYLLFAFPPGAEGRQFLSDLLPLITHGGVDLATEPPPRWLCNVGLTFQGLHQLGLDPALLSEMDPMFRESPQPGPMGDFPGSPSEPKNWWEQQFKTEELHCIVQLYSKDSAVLNGEATDTVLQIASQRRVKELFPREKPDHQGSHRLNGSALIHGVPQAPGQPTGRGRLHFGYIDGFTRPDVSWEGTPAGKQLHFRHFLLGYGTKQDFSAPHTGPSADFFRDGSYMVLRWIYQDVAKFNKYLEDAAPVLAPDLPPEQGREFVAAKMMGRWRDGTPLVLSPTEPRNEGDRDFSFHAEDPHGHRCPFSAHIRVVNPRDQPLNPSVTDGVPSVIRRGIPYGPELAPGATVDDGVDRGILGVFICANIRRQFYTLTHWVAENSFSPVFNHGKTPQDALFANRAIPTVSKTFRVPSSTENKELPELPDFVHTKGTAFFLLPSLNTLRAIAGL